MARVEEARTRDEGRRHGTDPTQSASASHDSGGRAMWGGAHVRAEHVAGNERRLAASLGEAVAATGGALNPTA